MLILLLVPCLLSSTQPPAIISVGKTQLHVCAEGIIRVTKTPTATFPKRVELIAKADWPEATYSKQETANSVIVSTSLVTATVSKSTGLVSFCDTNGKTMLSETNASFVATSDMGKSTYVIEQSWSNEGNDAIYGGGEYQNGIVNFKNAPIQMVQFNTEAVVPFFVSTKGYGILWDNYAWTYLNPANTEVKMSPIADASSSLPLQDGCPIVLDACVASGADDAKQQWKFDSSDHRIKLYNEESHKMVLDYDNVKDNLHLWTESPNFPGNQQWVINGKSIVNSQSKQCLTAKASRVGAAVTVAACDASSALQQWTFDNATGHLTSVAGAVDQGIARRRGPFDERANGDNSVLCLAADDTERPSAVGTFTARVSGDHHFYIDACPGPLSIPPGTSFGCGMGKVLKLWITGMEETPVVNWEQLTNLPNSITGRAALEAGKTYTVNFAYTGFKTSPKILVNGPDYGRTTLKSMQGDLIDYYYTHGGSHGGIDRAIAGYREITGTAPLYGKWAYGFWQCKEHYKTQAEVQDAAAGFRARSIPLDNIVQDWHYWGNLGWGPQWDPAVYPHPDQMVKNLSAAHVRLMVSVWSKFDSKTKFFKQMTQEGFMLNGTSYYDAWNADAREQFYQYSKAAMFSIGVDALWLDATEPEGFPNVGHATALGSGDSVMNSYSLMTTKAIADGLRRDYPAEQGARVFSLTRSSFAGQQSTGAALWSGDISGKWDSFRRQVATSINYQLSGIPYWSEDMGGFFRPSDQYTSPDYRNLLVRWFQFGTFTPLFRVHGGGSNTEMWNYGDDVLRLLNATNNLRYRLLPYTYSGFHRVETEHYTMQRGLAFDFSTDARALEVADEFMWGDAFLVAPVVRQCDSNNGSRTVYLPSSAGSQSTSASTSTSTSTSTSISASASSGWVDFWTGDTKPAGDILAPAPIDQTPIYVRAGSIVPMGPFVQHTGEKPADPMEVRVYAGADASFVLFEDDGLSLKYQSGTDGRSMIKFHYEAATNSLTIGARNGSYAGMPATRAFDVVFVASGKGVGLPPTPRPDQYVVYSGAAVTVKGPSSVIEV